MKPLYRVLLTVCVFMAATGATWWVWPGDKEAPPAEPMTIYCAAKTGNIPWIQEYLVSGGDIKGVNDAGESPLSMAAAHGQLEAVKLLWAAGAGKDEADADGCSLALSSAIYHGKADIVRFLLKSGAVYQYPSSDTEFCRAMLMGDVATVRTCLQRNKSLFRERVTWHDNAFYTAVRLGYGEIIHELIAAAGGVNEIGESFSTPMFTAISHGHLSAVDALVKSGYCKVDGHAICTAVSYKNRAICRYLLKAGGNMNDPDFGSWTPLTVAVRQLDEDLVRFVLSEGADATQDAQAVEAAVEWEAISILQLLLDAGAPLHAAFCHAVCKGKTDTVKWLLGRDLPASVLTSVLPHAYRRNDTGIIDLLEGAGADPRAVNLFLPAVQSGNVELVKKYLSSGGQIGADGMEALRSAAGSRNNRMVRFLLENGVFPVESRDIHELLSEALMKKNKECVELFLHAGIITDLGGEGNPELNAAVLLGDAEKVKQLITPAVAAATEYYEWPYVMQALYMGHREVALVLLEAGASPECPACTGESPFYLAFTNGDKVLMKSLSEAGASVNRGFMPGGASPLHQAAEKGDLEMVKFLVELGAHVDDGGGDYLTPLAVAISGGHREIVDFLLECGADAELECSTGMNAVKCAARGNNLEILQLLIERGCSVDYDGPEHEYETPLTIAIYNGSVECARYLISRGANVNVVDSDGKSLLELSSNPQIRQMLLDAGAKDTPPAESDAE